MTLLNRRGDVMDFELISTEVLYEDDDVVVIKRTGKAFNAVVDNIDVAIKNEDGDITNIVELKSKIVKYI
jgi:predicted Rdx family selenoprotein